MSESVKTGDLGASLTASAQSPNQKLGTSPEPIRLTPVEIELQRRNKWEIAQRFAENRTNRKVERAVLANPDLPVSFVAESLMSMAEPREDSLPFVPRGLPTDG